MNGADTIAHILKTEGIEILPSFPHSEIIEAASKQGIKPIIVRQERQAFHIADGYARVTGGKKICATTVQAGPGSENAIGAVAQCFGDNVPVLHLPGGYPLDQQQIRPNFNGTRNMQFINKYCEMAASADRLPQLLQNAFAMLRNGRPGPVTIEVPDDIFYADVDQSMVNAYRVQRRSTPYADPADIKEFADALLNAKCPIIVAGQGILYAEGCGELRALAELTQTPVMTTLNGKSAFPENHPLSLGCGGRSRPDHLINFLDQADLILGLGTSFTRSTFITPLPTQGRTFLQLTNWEGDISKDYPVDHGIIGDAKHSVAALVREIKGRASLPNRMTGNTTAEEIAKARNLFMEKWLPILTSNETPITPYRVIWDLMKVIDREKSTVTHDAGSPRDHVTAFYEAINPHTYLGWGKTTQLGTGLGLVQGAKLAKPDWTCVNFMGDAAIGMVLPDIETGVRYNIGTTSIIFRNSIMGSYSDYHPVATERFAINELGGDYVAVAEALGAYGERVTAPNEISAALTRAFAKNADGVPAVVEVITREEKRFANTVAQGTVQP